MNPVMESLQTRKSVRVFEGKPISTEVRGQILQAAFEAPTAGNQQLYTILDITDPVLKGKLAESCDHQPFIAKAPLVLVFCADPLKWVDAYADVGLKPRALGAGDLMLAVQDATIAAQNAVTAAWSLGVGSCYIGDIMENCEEQRMLLGLPEEVFACAMVVFGYPTAQQAAREKPKRAQERFVVRENAYHRMDGAELREMLGDRIGGQEYETWCKAFGLRKYESEFAVELNRSVAKVLEAFPFTHR